VWISMQRWNISFRNCNLHTNSWVCKKSSTDPPSAYTAQVLCYWRHYVYMGLLTSMNNFRNLAIYSKKAKDRSNSCALAADYMIHMKGAINIYWISFCWQVIYFADMWRFNKRIILLFLLSLLAGESILGIRIKEAEQISVRNILAT
jgi:hypothetical protein